MKTPNPDDQLPTNECGVCHQPKPINEYCGNECRDLLDANFEDAVTSILGRFHGNGMKATEAYYSIDYLFKTFQAEAYRAGQIVGLKEFQKNTDRTNYIVMREYLITRLAELSEKELK